MSGKALPVDLFLLCSDGLTDMVEDVLVQHILSSAFSLLQKATELIEAANSEGGSDNIMVVLSEIE